MVSGFSIRQGFLCGLLFSILFCAGEPSIAFATSLVNSQPSQSSTDDSVEDSTEFGQMVDKDEAAAKQLQQTRLVMVGAACMVIVGSIMILFAYFRMNLATRGFYAGRLQVITTLSFILLGALVYWFVNKYG